MSTLSAMRASSEARLKEEKRQVDRRRNLVVLMMRHMTDSGYTEAAERLQAESGISLSRLDVADNIDLPYILGEFEEYHEMKLGRKPTLVRKVAGKDTPRGRGGSGSGTGGSGRAGRRPPRRARSGGDVTSGAGGSGGVSAGAGAGAGSGAGAASGATSDTGGIDSDDGGFGVAGKQVKIAPPGSGPSAAGSESRPPSPKMLKPIGSFSSSPELLELAAVISRDIYQHNPNVRWDDVVELHDAKRLLKEAVVMPVKYPQIFTGVLTPWRGILLYGPPGTGKTMLARAVATECHTTFFNISASSIVSKWRGDSEKLIRVLFELARHHAPSTIFLDEIDSIMGQRGGGGMSEHEASRRMKTEILVQMDGLSKTNDLVFVLAASNLPWELDMAMLRRLEKRVLVPLPGPAAREIMLRKRLPEDRSDGLPYAEVAKGLKGFSGSDITLLTKEASMQPVRRLMLKLEALEAETGGVVGEELVKLDPVSMEDLANAIRVTRPSARLFAGKYDEWQKEFGST